MKNLPNRTCERCGSPSASFQMSYFNTQWLCQSCQDVERQHPDYEKARQTELKACLQGDRNFPGIGLPSELQPAKNTGADEA